MMNEIGINFPLDIQRNQRSVRTHLAYVETDHYTVIHDQYRSFLHTGEIAYFDNLIAEKRKLSYLLGRYAAKIAVSRLLNESDLTKIEISFGTFEQPIVNYVSFNTPDVTISHCDGVAMAIATQAGHVMGIDIEKIDFSKTHVFKSQITEDEAKKASQQFEDERVGFHMIWTAKEALSKTIKCGLTVPFDILQLDNIIPASTINNVYESSFKNFAQYKCLSWQLKNYLLSIVLPKKSMIPIGIKDLLIFRAHK